MANRIQEIENLMRAAVECSIFISPTDPGLTHAELIQIASVAGYEQGEVADAAHRLVRDREGNRYLPGTVTCSHWQFFGPEEPEYRSFEALDFVVDQLNERVRKDGQNRAQLERTVLVERATASGHSKANIEAAITYLVFAKFLTEQNGVLRYRHKMELGRPSETKAKFPHETKKPLNSKAYPLAQDIIQRRTDGRLPHVEALDAFAESLSTLGYGSFRLWWQQTVAEFRQIDANSTPLSKLVLAAALVEGSLTFVVRHGKTLGAFQSSTFRNDPRTWKIDDLINSAASGGVDAILDNATKVRAVTLVATRQRIHAGRMLSEHPQGVPDLRPEEARDARQTADQVVRKILEWLQRCPPT